MRNVQRKGISPLVAAVLLIAFTMSIAVILTAWVTNFTTTQKENAEKYDESLSCAYQDITAQPSFTRYNSTDHILETYITSAGVEGAEITQVSVSMDGKSFLTPKNIASPSPIKINKNEGKSILINLTALISGTQEPKKIRFYTSCGPDYFTTLTTPSGGWAPLNNYNTGDVIQLEE